MKSTLILFTLYFIKYLYESLHDLDDPFIELINHMEKLKSLGIYEFCEELSREEFGNFYDTVAAT